MDNTNNKNLSFPQRNWLLLCILVAILSPLVVHWVTAAAHHESYQQTVDIKPAQPVNSSDTSNKIAAPPMSDGGQQPANKPPDSLNH